MAAAIGTDDPLVTHDIPALLLARLRRTYGAKKLRQLAKDDPEAFRALVRAVLDRADIKETTDRR